MTEVALQLDPPKIPDKLYFRIGEVSHLLGVEPHVLRFWETEFPSLAPKKSGTGHRLFRRKDVELLLRIKQLLYDRRYTIEGARQALQAEHKDKKTRPSPKRTQANLFGDPSDPLPDIRREISDILRMLKSDLR